MRALAVLSAVLVTGCGLVPDFPDSDGGGTVCYLDADCVPNGCCGDGTWAVHVDEAPDCSAVRCSGSCPLAEVNCGCGLPVCRQNRCSVAVSTDPACP